MGKEERNIYTIQKDESIGEVKIADEVVASIAAFAAMEVEGVASLGGMTKEREPEVMSKGASGICIMSGCMRE